MTEQATRPTEKNEPLPTCDRCRTVVTLTGYRAVHKDGRELILCKVHVREHGDALGKQHWTIEPLVPPEPVPGTKAVTRCGRSGVLAHTLPPQASPESRTVDVVHCESCDVRVCNYTTGQDFRGEAIKCRAKSKTRDERLCPKGHPLMGEAE